MVVLELLHLKMEVTVSEPCDVIRVGQRQAINVIYFFNIKSLNPMKHKLIHC